MTDRHIEGRAVSATTYKKHGCRCPGCTAAVHSHAITTCFRCPHKLGRERFVVHFPTRDNDDALGTRTGEVHLCGRCFDELMVFLRGAPA